MIQDAITLFLSIFIEAAPFILLGVLVSTGVKFWLPEKKIIKFLPKNIWGKSALMSLMGMFFPVCECGNVPVAKQMIAKKIPAGATLSFLLGAPILNPIVIITTIVAFPNQPVIWFGRIGLGFLIALIIGVLFSYAKPDFILAKQANANGGGCCHNHNKKSAENFFDHAINEFVTMASILAVGAAIAAATQSFIPREVLTSLTDSAFLSILAMMALAFIVSICSTTDAFFALAYAHIFSPAALIAFLVFGPMIDLKALLLMRTTFSAKTLVLLTFFVSLLVFSLSFALDIFWL